MNTGIKTFPRSSSIVRFLIGTLILAISLTQNCKNPVKSDNGGVNSEVYSRLLNVGSENLFEFTFDSDSSSSGYTKARIGSAYSIVDVYCFGDRNLVVAASREHLYFIDGTSNEILKTLNIPDTENPEPNYGPWEIRILPYDGERCILANRSLYLVNLSSKSIDRNIFDASKSNQLLYMRQIKISEDGAFIYLLNQLFGEGLTTRVSRLKVANGETQLFREDNLISRGYELLAPTTKYLIILDGQTKYAYRYSNNTLTLLDSTQLGQDLFFLEGTALHDKLYLQDSNSSSFFELDPEEMAFRLIWSYSNESNGGATFFRDSRDQLIACFDCLQSYKSVISNLSTKVLLREFIVGYPNTIYLVPDRKL